MYIFLLILQIVSIIVGFAGIILLTRLWSTVNVKFMLIMAVCTTIYSVGYFVEMIATTREMALAAASFEYTGFAFAALAFLYFFVEYCNLKRPRLALWHTLFLLDFMAVMLVMTSNYHNLYYSKVDFVNEGVFPHLQSTKGIGFYLFLLIQMVEMIGVIGLIIVKRKRVVKKEEKRLYTFLLIECLLPEVGAFVGLLVDLKGYDPTSVLNMIMMISITLTITRGRFVDIVPIALSTLFQNVGDAVIIADIKGNYMAANDRAKEIFPQMKSWPSLTPMAELDLIHTGEEHKFENKGRYYSSECLEINQNNNKCGFVITVHDETELIRQYKQMEALKLDADAANSAKSLFLANMSHEIRTPLSAVIGMAEVSEKESDEKTIRENIAQIKESGNMLLDIVNDVLDFSKAESGRLEIIEVPYSPRELFSGICNVGSIRIGEKPVEFIADVDPEIPAILKGDDVRIRQILLNFVTNAAKFTQAGSIVLKVDCEYEEDRILLTASVKDSGQGIKKEDIGKLFKPFSQINQELNRKIVGTGLGLSICDQLAQLMQGEIRVESEYEKGSEFTLILPQTIVDRRPMVEGAKRKPQKVIPLTKFSLYEEYDKVPTPRENLKLDKADFSCANVLVVDDNKVNQKVILSYLKHFGITAQAAGSGMEAIEMVEKTTFNLILMDHMMPDMDGVETTRRIRQMDNVWKRNIPIVACTANVVKGVEKVFAEAGMDDMIQKPINVRKLEEVLDKFLGQMKG